MKIWFAAVRAVRGSVRPVGVQTGDIGVREVQRRAAGGEDLAEDPDSGAE